MRSPPPPWVEQISEGTQAPEKNTEPRGPWSSLHEIGTRMASTDFRSLGGIAPGVRAGGAGGCLRQLQVPSPQPWQASTMTAMAMESVRPAMSGRRSYEGSRRKPSPGGETSLWPPLKSAIRDWSVSSRQRSANETTRK